MSDHLKEIIQWFLNKDKRIDHKKLQCLLYYAQCWTITLMNEPFEKPKLKLFNEDFEAWTQGPIIPIVYDQRDYLNQINIEKNITLNPDILDILYQVLDVYGNFSGNELQNIIKQEQPWQDARLKYKPLEICHENIKTNVIYNYYIHQMNLN